MDNPIETAFDTAVAGQAQPAAPQGQAPEAPQPIANQTEGQADNTTQEAPKETAPEKGQADREWDGKPESLPNELKQDPKAIQRAYTRKAMALADAEKRLKDYEGVSKQDLEAYRVWKSQQQQQVVQQPVMPTQLSPEQYELIKNDPQQLQTYVQSLVNSQLQQAAQVIGQEIGQIKHAQSVAEWERVISDFGEVHPDMWKMHQLGFFQPILDATVKGGGTLEDAYAKGEAILKAMETELTQKTQARVHEKKSAVTFTGNNPSSDADVVTIDDRKRAIDKAFDFAWDKKQTKVKVKNL